jgi:hypothetical protein
MLLTLKMTKISSDITDRLVDIAEKPTDAVMNVVDALNPSVSPASIKSQDQGRKNALTLGAITGGLGLGGAGLLSTTSKSGALPKIMSRYGFASAPVAIASAYAADRAHAAGFGPDSALGTSAIAGGLLGGAGLLGIAGADKLPLASKVKNMIRAHGGRAVAVGAPVGALAAGLGVHLRKKQSEYGTPELLLAVGAVPMAAGIRQLAINSKMKSLPATAIGAGVGGLFALSRREESQKYGRMGMKPTYDKGEKMRGALMSGAINTGLAAALSGKIPLKTLPLAYAAMTGASYANRTATQQIMQREADKLDNMAKQSAASSRAQQTGSLMGGRSSRSMFGGGVLGAKRPNSLASTSSRPGRTIGQSASFSSPSGSSASGRMRDALRPSSTAPIAKMTPMAPMSSTARSSPKSPIGRPMIAPASNPQRGARVALKKASAPATLPASVIQGVWRGATLPIRAVWKTRVGKAGIGMGAAGLMGGGVYKSVQPIRRLRAENIAKLTREGSSANFKQKQDLAAALWR